MVWSSYGRQQMKKLLVIIFLLSGSYSYGYWGAGDVTCDQIISGHDNTNKAGRFQVIDWMNGYITGRNIETKSNKGKDLGDESLYYAVLNFCKKNPLRSLVIAAEYIYERELD